MIEVSQTGIQAFHYGTWLATIGLDLLPLGGTLPLKCQRLTSNKYGSNNNRNRDFLLEIAATEPSFGEETAKTIVCARKHLIVAADLLTAVDMLVDGGCATMKPWVLVAKFCFQFSLELRDPIQACVSIHCQGPSSSGLIPERRQSLALILHHTDMWRCGIDGPAHGLRR